MIHVFNYPVEPSTNNEFYKEKDDGEEKVFDGARQRTKIDYTKDGRKMVDGKVEEEKSSGDLWSAAITRGAAHEWREKASRGRWQRLQHHVRSASYEMGVAVRQATPRTWILVAVNALLSLALLRLFKLI